MATVFKKDDEYSFLLADGTKFQIPADNKAMLRVAEAEWVAGGQKPPAEPKEQPEPRNIQPQLPIVIIDKGNHDQPQSTSSVSSSDNDNDSELDVSVVVPTLKFGDYFVKPTEVNLIAIAVMNNIKSRPKLVGKAGTILKNKFIKECVNIESDSFTQILCFIGTFFAANSRNYSRKIMVQVLYETLYHYMETHRVVMTKCGAQEIHKVIKDRAPSFTAREMLFMKRDTPKCLIAYKFNKG